MKRFYKSVTLGEETEAGFGLFLDGKPVRTPARHDFVIPTQALADVIVAEWAAQEEEIIPTSMPVSQMTMTLTDRVIPHRHVLSEEILGYIDTDLICYRASEPEQYKKAQEAKWDPFISWFEAKFKVKLQTTNGLSPLTQGADVHHAIHAHISGLNDHQFMAAYIATLGMGSIILAIAFETKSFSTEDVLSAAFAEELLKDEIYLGHIYGSAPDQEKKYASLKSDLDALQHFI